MGRTARASSVVTAPKDHDLQAWAVREARLPQEPLPLTELQFVELVEEMAEHWCAEARGGVELGLYA